MNARQTHPMKAISEDVHEPMKKLRPASDLVEYLRQYTRERPHVVALYCFGIGFVLGWKLKPW